MKIFLVDDEDNVISIITDVDKYPLGLESTNGIGGVRMTQNLTYEVCMEMHKAGARGVSAPQKIEKKVMYPGSNVVGFKR